MSRIFAYRNLRNIPNYFRKKYDPFIEFMIGQSTEWINYMIYGKNIAYVKNTNNKNKTLDYYERVKTYTTSGKLIAESINCYKNQRLIAIQSDYTGYKEELTAWNEWWKKNLNPKAFVSKFLFKSGTPGEIWQIFGLAYIKVKGKSILYINKLSDFALSASLGIPIRFDHFGMENREEALKPFSNYLTINGPNREVWDALLRVYGSSLKEYESRLH